MVDLCDSEWVILLDYDNTVTKTYLDSMFAIPTWDTECIYCSDWAFPHFQFKELSGTVISFSSACDMAVNDSLNGPFFNDGNYLVPRSKFVRTMKPYWNYHVAASDVIFANYIWLSNGGKLSVVRGSQYIHRIHPGSTWLNAAEESLSIIVPIKQAFRIKAMPWDGWMDRELNKNSNNWMEPTPISLR